MLATEVKICAQPTNSPKTPVCVPDAGRRNAFSNYSYVWHFRFEITVRLLHKYRVLFSAANVYNAL